jgi:hypothetical protein
VPFAVDELSHVVLPAAQSGLPRRSPRDLGRSGRKRNRHGMNTASPIRARIPENASRSGRRRANLMVAAFPYGEMHAYPVRPTTKERQRLKR